MRRIVYISGTRADFGLMSGTLAAINADPAFYLSVLITGMHLDPQYGNTWQEIEAAGLHIAGKVPVALDPPTKATMARAIGTMVSAFTDILEADAPDMVLLLGDRGEMLAGAIAAMHLNIAVAHIHGGERSGTIDESIRHAVSKLSHIHFAATENARTRLIALGERPECIFVSGAPGLDTILDREQVSRDQIITAAGLDPLKKTALVLFHPVLQESANAAVQMQDMLSGLEDADWQGITLMPNADAGSDAVRRVLEDCAYPGLHRLLHLPRKSFLNHMAVLDAMLGNSSSGIIEAASFGTPVLNIGSRQNLRERNENVIDLPVDRQQIADALSAVSRRGRSRAVNIYGDGQASARIRHHLKEITLDDALFAKVIAY